MTYFLYVIFFLSCVVLIASVLLQPGKTDAGALFTSNISSTAFQPRGSQTILSKMTIAAAAIFMLTALFLAMPVFNGGVSVLETTTAETTAEPTPATDANANTATNANVADANANTANANTANTNAVNANLPSNQAIVVNNNSANAEVNKAVNASTNANKAANANK